MREKIKESIIFIFYNIIFNIIQVIVINAEQKKNHKKSNDLFLLRIVLNIKIKGYKDFIVEKFILSWLLIHVFIIIEVQSVTKKICKKKIAVIFKMCA